ncbi:hypothetical protein GCM10017557_19380 [Streptomyces aurantiacus]|uniref:Uncharacterized protein n=1 Tax=Streptomyces aurantiacus TaxID=47760 RepID=A0A7G1NW02_9ACTN|nr:hypothetical protein GCM10017557_19380 [Streptomyces aurantiacus]
MRRYGPRNNPSTGSVRKSVRASRVPRLGLGQGERRGQILDRGRSACAASVGLMTPLAGNQKEPSHRDSNVRVFSTERLVRVSAHCLKVFRAIYWRGGGMIQQQK